MCGCTSSVTKTTIIGRRSFKKNTSSNKQESICAHKYSELATLDLKIIQLLKITKDSILVESSQQLRKWIKDLDNGCPNSFELEIVTEYVDNEYTKYFT